MLRLFFGVENLLKFLEILFSLFAFGFFLSEHLVGHPTRELRYAPARHILDAFAFVSRILARSVHSFHNETNLVGFAKAHEHGKHFLFVFIRAEILRFASQIIESKIGKHVQRIVIFAKRRRANLVAELAQTIVSCSAVFVQFCQRRYEKGNYKSALFVPQIFDGGRKHVKILVVLQKASGNRKIVGDVGDKKILFHHEVVIDKFFKSDNIEFVDAHRAFRDIKIIANAHSAEIAVVQNLKRVDKCNLFRLARSVCHSAEEEIDGFV